MRNDIVRAEGALTELCDAHRRALLLTHAKDAVPRARVATLVHYENGRIHLVVEGEPNTHVADARAALFGDDGATLFFAEGAAVGHHDPGALRARWSKALAAMYPRLEPDLLAVTLSPVWAEAWTRERTSGLGFVRAAARAFRRGGRVDVRCDERHFVLARPVDPPARDPRITRPSHA